MVALQTGMILVVNYLSSPILTLASTMISKKEVHLMIRCSFSAKQLDSHLIDIFSRGLCAVWTIIIGEQCASLLEKGTGSVVWVFPGRTHPSTNLAQPGLTLHRTEPVLCDGCADERLSDRSYRPQTFYAMLRSLKEIMLQSAVAHMLSVACC